MDYEKAYKEALETARKLNSGEGVAAHPGWTVCEVIFPELKESEDEQIRKWIINHLEYNFLNTSIADERIKCKEALAWLEKQKPIKWSEDDERIWHNIVGDIKGLKSHCTKTLDDYFFQSLNWLREIKQKLGG